MRRAATPADAAAVWQSIEAAGGKPTVRAVADALNASGEFDEKITKSKVGRWKQAGWRAPDEEQQLARAAAKVEAAVPALTGNPSTRVRDVVGEMHDLADIDVARRYAREAAMAGVGLLRQIEEDAATLVAEKPASLASLVSALSGQIAVVNSVLAPRAVGPGPTIDMTAEEEPLDPAWAQFLEPAGGH